MKTVQYQTGSANLYHISNRFARTGANSLHPITEYTPRVIDYITEWKDRGALGEEFGLLRWKIYCQRVDLTLCNNGNLKIKALKILIKDR